MGMMTIISPPCVICGFSTILEGLDEEKVERWKAGEHVQYVWPEMQADQREVLITGTHPTCWVKIFGEEE